MMPQLLKPLLYRVIALSVLATYSFVCQAEYQTGRISYALDIERSKSDWHYTTSRLRTKQSLLGISWEEALASRLKGGLRIGYLDLSQPDNPIPAAQVTTGYYAGLNLSILLLTTDTFETTFDLDYSYRNSRGTQNSQTAEFVWYQSEAGLNLSWQFLQQTYLTLGGHYHVTDGEQRLSGTLTQTTVFEQDQHSGYQAGLAYQVDRSGTIGASWLGGNRDGVRIYFNRVF